jgi:hypothetical protein
MRAPLSADQDDAVWEVSVVMKVQDWIFSVRYWSEDDVSMYGHRYAVVGPAQASTVEAALRPSEMPEVVRAAIRACEVVRDFVDGRLDPDKSGYYVHAHPGSAASWTVCIGSVQEVLS